MHFMHALSAMCVKGGFARDIGRENAFETFGWNVYDFSGLGLRPWIAASQSTNNSEVKAS
jgi:hypothetical protein